MAIDGKLVDALLEGRTRVEDIVGENGLLKQFMKAVLERALQEMYRVEVSPGLISQVTGGLCEEVKSWQRSRPISVLPVRKSALMLACSALTGSLAPLRMAYLCPNRQF
jgi:hypothetical protein